MAEGILKHIAKEKGLKINVKSAGVFALDGSNISIEAINVMEDVGIDILNYESTSIGEKLIKESDLIFTMGNSHKQILLDRFPLAEEKIFLLNEYAFASIKDIEDPFGGSRIHYEKARDEIYKAILEIVKE